MLSFFIKISLFSVAIQSQKNSHALVLYTKMEKQYDINGQRESYCNYVVELLYFTFITLRHFVTLLQNLLEFCLSKHPFQIQVTNKYYGDHLYILYNTIILSFAFKCINDKT